MSSRSRSAGKPGAQLDRIWAELREQSPPSGAPGVPPRLQAEFRRLASERGATPAPRLRLGRRWWPALALAAAAGVAAVWGARSGSWLSPHSLESAASAQLDGRPLAIGELVIAGERPRRVEHSGRASWQLAPGSRGRLLSTAGNVLRVSLEQGSLDAEVQPSAVHESFIVQARGTEVAVHGTRFRVSLLEGVHVRVAVSQGVVRVRPVSAGARASGTTLAAGAGADFWAGALEPPASALPSTLGSQTAPAPTVPLPSTAPSHSEAQLRNHAAAASPASAGSVGTAAQPGAGHRGAPPAGAAPATAAPAAKPSAAGEAVRQGTPPAASAESALQTVTERVQSCFQRELQGSNEVGIEASTQLALWVEPDGTLLRADFDPPLAPAVERCVASQLAQLRVASSPAGYRVERQIRLRR